MTSNPEIRFTDSPSPRHPSLSLGSTTPVSSAAAQLPHSPPPSPALSRMSELPNDELGAVMNGGNGTLLHDVVLSPVVDTRDSSSLPIVRSQDPTSSLSQELTLREPNERLSQGPTTRKDEQKPMRRRKLSFGRWNPTLTLENKGSVARDHLASERTYLAYVRTSLTVSSTGVALVQLFTIAATSNQSIERFSRPLGATIIMLGLLTLLLGVVRYFSIQFALVQGDFPVARVSSALLGAALMIIVITVFVVLLATR